MRMCAWDDSNYILGAGTRAGSDREDRDGIVDGHAYSVLTVLDNVAGTEVDLTKTLTLTRTRTRTLTPTPTLTLARSTSSRCATRTAAAR